MDIIKGVILSLSLVTSYLYGEFSGAIVILVCMIGADVVTGILAAFYEGKVDSKVSRKGMTRKAGMLLMVALGHIIGTHAGLGETIRDAACYFYVVNEFISITENYARMNLPIPDALKKALALYKGKGDVEK